MITFSNGRKIQYFVASGALAFDTKGWPWEWLLVWLGLIDRTLFGIAIKSLTKNKLKGNLLFSPLPLCRPRHPYSHFPSVKLH